MTAKEAYRLAEPAIWAWHEDAVLEYVGTGTSDRWVHNNGTSDRWGFGVATMHKSTEVVIWGGSAPVVGIDGIPGFEKPGGLVRPPFPPLDELSVDSNEAVAIARQHGVSSQDRLIRIELMPPNPYDGVPLSWELTYGDEDDLLSYRTIFIDVYTGEVVGRNDFAK